MLERRPDIRAAEQDLIAANAQIGVAKARIFPAIEPERIPGRAKHAARKSVHRPDERLESGAAGYAAYLHRWTLEIECQAGGSAARERADPIREDDSNRVLRSLERLIAHQRVRESREQQEALVAALQDRLRLAYLRYRGGVDTQLDALDADRDLFSAQLSLSQIRLNELLTVVQLYKALGGGWQ